MNRDITRGDFEEIQFDKNGKQIDEMVEGWLPQNWNEKDLILAKFRTKIHELFYPLETDLEIKKNGISIYYFEEDFIQEKLFIKLDDTIEQLQMDMKKDV